ncbi:NAD-dependent dehydratase [archaeon 13_2_20CM_2_52_21]|nr:MAG: NAD-dependent dehydratase [archaeon 13_2_20CM_2_52_21]
MKDPIIDEDIDAIRRSIDSRAFQAKNVLVSGGSGFLGSWICDTLIRLSSKVICLDNLSTGVFENIDHLKAAKSFKFEKADVCTYSKNLKVDMIFHLASRPAPEDYQKHPVETALANATGTDRMLDLARKNDARVFYASSSEAYGDPEVFPTPESYEGKVDPLGPRSSYEEGKRFGEALCRAYHDQYGLDVRIARLFNSYGPRLRAEGLYGRVISRFITQALRGDDITVFGDGSQTRSFSYVTDTISGSLVFMGLDRSSEMVLNIGTQEEIKILDLVDPIRRLTGSKSTVRFLPFPAGDHMRRLPDIGRAKKVLAWSPTVSFADGLERTLKWFHSIKTT